MDGLTGGLEADGERTAKVSGRTNVWTDRPTEVRDGRDGGLAGGRAGGRPGERQGGRVAGGWMGGRVGDAIFATIVLFCYFLLFPLECEVLHRFGNILNKTAKILDFTLFLQPSWLLDRLMSPLNMPIGAECLGQLASKHFCGHLASIRKLARQQNY